MHAIPLLENPQEKKLVIFKKPFNNFGKRINYEFFIVRQATIENFTFASEQKNEQKLAVVKKWPKIYSERYTKQIDKLGHIEFLIGRCKNVCGLLAEATEYYPKGKNQFGAKIHAIHDIKCLGYYLEAICLNDLIKNEGVTAVSTSVVLLEGRKNQLFNEHINLEYLKNYPAKEWMLAMARGIRHARELLQIPNEPRLK